VQEPDTSEKTDSIPDSTAPDADSSAPVPDSPAPDPDSSAPVPDSPAPDADSSAPDADSSAPDPDIAPDNIVQSTDIPSSDETIDVLSTDESTNISSSDGSTNGIPGNTHLDSSILHDEMVDFLSSRMDLEQYIFDIDKILRMRFILKGEVIEFIETLPERVTRIKTTIRKDPERTKGVIKGKIDWQRTIKSRFTQNPKDKTHFYVDLIERNYNIPENIVLKEMLSIIYQIVFGDLEDEIENTDKYPHLKKLIQEKSIREVIEETYLKNIYIRRISAEETENINERMIMNTMKSRNPLYQDAAHLLQSYREFIQGSKEKYEKMLDH